MIRSTYTLGYAGNQRDGELGCWFLTGAPFFENNDSLACLNIQEGSMSLATVALNKPIYLIETTQAKIRNLKREGCICIHSVYGMTQEEFEQSTTYRKLTSMNPQRYFIGPSLCAGKMRGVALWRRPLTS